MENFSVTYTSNGKREFLPRGQVSTSIVNLLFIIAAHKLEVSVWELF